MNVCLPIDPPADIEQNSKTPSNAGLSSPTRTIKGIKSERVKQNGKVQQYILMQTKLFCREKEHTSCPRICHLLRRLGRHIRQEMDILVRMERAHHLRCRSFRSLRKIHTNPNHKISTTDSKPTNALQSHQNVHLIQHSIRSDQIMRDSYSMRLHGMSQAITVRADVR